MEVLQSVLLDVRCQAAPSNNLTERLEAVKSVLNRAIDGESGLIISPRCGHLRKALSGGYHYKTVRSANGARTLETPEKNTYSHVADALQYCLSGGGEYQHVLYHRQHQQLVYRTNNICIEDYDFFEG